MSADPFARIEASFVGSSADLASLRRFLREAGSLLGRPPSTDALVATQELVRNAVALGDDEVKVAVCPGPGRALRVEVRDYGYGHPRPSEPRGDGPSGLGLRIVEALADRWGIDEFLPGKIVWFELEEHSPTRETGSPFSEDPVHVTTARTGQHPDTAVLAVAGPLDPTGARALARELAAAPSGDLVVDLAEVSFIDSAGIRALLDGARDRHGAGGTLRLRNVPARVHHLLDRVGLAPSLTIEPLVPRRPLDPGTRG